MRPANIILMLIALAICGVSSAAEAGVVIVVSAKSPITALSKNQVADIFLGKSNRYPDGTRATPIDQPETSSVRQAFYNEVAGQSLAQVKSHWSKLIFTGRGEPPRTGLNGVEVKNLLIANLSAISYIEESEVDSSVRVLRAQ